MVKSAAKDKEKQNINRQVGPADGGLGEEVRVLQGACSRLYLADYALICLSAILGHFLLAAPWKT